MPLPPMPICMSRVHIDVSNMQVIGSQVSVPPLNPRFMQVTLFSSLPSQSSPGSRAPLPHGEALEALPPAPAPVTAFALPDPPWPALPARAALRVSW